MKEIEWVSHVTCTFDCFETRDLQWCRAKKWRHPRFRLRRRCSRERYRSRMGRFWCIRRWRFELFGWGFGLVGLWEFEMVVGQVGVPDRRVGGVGRRWFRGVRWRLGCLIRFQILRVLRVHGKCTFVFLLYYLSLLNHKSLSYQALSYYTFKPTPLFIPASLLKSPKISHSTPTAQ